MKRFYLVAVACAALTLGACATNGTLPDPNGTPPAPVVDISGQISQVQKIAAQVCGFVPTIETVSSLVGVFVPQAGVGISIANQIAEAICNAVTAKSVFAGYARATVRGVPISGEYVGRRKSLSGAPMINGVLIDGFFVAH